jgi:hypothetical protein
LRTLKKKDKIIVGAVVGIGALILLAVLWPKPAAAATTTAASTTAAGKAAPVLGPCPF